MKSVQGKRILVLHGPNLNLLGIREPHIYGSQTLEQINNMLAEESELLGLHLTTLQSNHEGVLIDKIQEAYDHTDGLIINPGGLTHTSVSLHDALMAYPHPIIEAHLSNLFRREDFRKHSHVSPAATAVICGFRGESYRLALHGIAELLTRYRDGLPSSN